MTRDDLIFVKSVNVTDTDNNGGRMGYNQVVNRIRFNIFPRVTKTERANGLTRYRKIFLWNREETDEPAFAPLVYLIHPTPASSERVYLALADDTDTQQTIVNNPNSYRWTGCGQLHVDANSGDHSIEVEFEDADYFVNNEMVIVLSSHFMIDQPMDLSVRPFAQVWWNGSKWVPQNAPSADQEDVYPYGTCLSIDYVTLRGTVFSYSAEGHLEFHRVAHSTDTVNSNESADGVRTDFTFDAPPENLPLSPYHVTITFTSGGTPYSGTDDGHGNFTGLHVSGTVDYDTGHASVTLGPAPDAGTAVTMIHAKRRCSWIGSVCTIELDSGLLNDFSRNNTYVAACFEGRDLIPSKEVQSISSGLGDYDLDHFIVHNKGTVYDTWTFSFTSSTSFTCTGSYSGDVGSGNIGSTFAPTNPDTNSPYFEVEPQFWGGTWQANDKIVIVTYPSSQGYWLKEVVDAGAAAFQYNYFMIETYIE